MRCEETMKREVTCVVPSDSVQTAAQKMKDANIGFLPIVDEEKRVLGVLTDRDIALRLVASDERASETQVETIMSRDLVACRPGDDLSECEKAMAEKKVSRVCCLDESGRLIGVISLSDLATIDGGRAGETLERVASREAQAQGSPPSVH